MSGQTLRCDIIIDLIHSIEVVTKSRRIFLDSSPEMLEVMAKNIDGDTFTTVNGVEFDWSLKNNNGHGDIVRIKTFKDSDYKSPIGVKIWELNNRKGSMILIKGVKAGVASVLVKPIDQEYQNVKAQKVKIIVMPNIKLTPTEMFVLPGSTFKYSLYIIKHGRTENVSLDEYSLQVKDHGIMRVNEKTLNAESIKCGTTTIVIKNKINLNDEVNEYLPSSKIFVSFPAYINISFLPGNSRSIEKRKSYTVTVNLFDINRNLISITDHVRINITYPSEYLKVLKQTVNGSVSEIIALKAGFCKISAVLLGITMKDGLLKKIEPMISITEDIVIYNSITIQPPFTILPWDPVLKPTYTIYFKASGGTGFYKWNCNSSLAAIANVPKYDEHQVKVVAFGQGTFQVQATDSHFNLFTGFANVSIQRVADIKILPKAVEAEINSSVILPLAMYGTVPDKTAKLFNDCSKVPVSVDIDDIQKFTYIPENNSPVSPSACRNINLKCIAEGYTKVHIHYQNQDISLKKTVVIGCYRKLEVVDSSSEAVIGLGTSLDIVFQGGPVVWPRCQSYFVNNSPEYDYVHITVEKNKSNNVGVHKVNILCKGYGETSFVLAVGNHPCEFNRFPAISEASYRINCSMPEVVILQPVLPSIEGEKCPASGENLIAIHSNQDLLIELIIKDNYGHEFQNISSFKIKWILSDYTLAHFASNEDVKEKETFVPDSHYRAKYFYRLHPYGQEGIIKVTASITGYKFKFVKDLDLINDKMFPAINGSLKLILLDKPESEPEKVLVFNSPSNKVSDGAILPDYVKVKTVPPPDGDDIFVQENVCSDSVLLKKGNKTHSIVEVHNCNWRRAISIVTLMSCICICNYVYSKVATMLENLMMFDDLLYQIG